MLLWLKANLVNIVLILTVALIVFFIVRSMIRDKREGRSSCGGNCSGCAACGGCTYRSGLKEQCSSGKTT